MRSVSHITSPKCNTANRYELAGRLSMASTDDAAMDVYADVLSTADITSGFEF